MAFAYGQSIAVDASNNVYLGGYFFGANLTTPALTKIGNQDAFIIKRLAANAPGAPTAVAAMAASGLASVTFTAPASDGGSAITGYTVTSIPAGGTDSNAGTTSLNHFIAGLTNGTAYTFTVVASNAAGASPASAASNSVTPLANTTTSVTSSANPVAAGSAVTFTATVAGTTPAGIINFRSSGTTIAGCGAVPLVSGSAQCTTTYLTIGTRTIDADYSGNASNAASTGTLSGGQSVIAPTIVLSPTSLPNGTFNTAYNQTITASGGTAAYSFTVTSGTLPDGLSLSTSGVLSGMASAGGIFNFTVTATDANAFTGARAYSLTIGGASQMVTFAPPTPVTFGASAITLTATASSGLTAFTFSTSSSASICTVSGNQLTIVGGGTCALTATEAGNANFAMASANANVVINAASQTVTFAPATPVTFGASAITLTATASSGLTAFTFSTSSAASVCTVSGSTLSIVGTGTCALTATQAGNANYAMVTANANVVINAASQTVTFAPSSPVTVGVTPITLTASSTSALTAFTFSTSSAASICTVAGNQLTIVGVGTCALTATQAGNANYGMASANANVVINAASQTVTFAPASPVNFGASAITLTATASSGLTAFTFSTSSTASICTVAGNQLTIAGTGTCALTATQPGDASYASASANANVVINPAFLIAQSRKTHGGAGPFNLTIDTTQAIGGLITVEPRIIGSGHTIVFQFNGAVATPGTVSVTPVGTAGTPTVSGNEVLVTLTNIPDNQRVTVTLVNVNGSVNPPPASLGFLVGDFNSSRSVNASDISAVKAQTSFPVSQANFKFDVNTSGGITSTDVSAVKARAGLVMP